MSPASDHDDHDIIVAERSDPYKPSARASAIPASL
jgi:hypothetical protein